MEPSEQPPAVPSVTELSPTVPLWPPPVPFEQQDETGFVGEVFVTHCRLFNAVTVTELQTQKAALLPVSVAAWFWEHGHLLGQDPAVEQTVGGHTALHVSRVSNL